MIFPGTLLEVESHGSMTAAQLVLILGLEKSSVSRMLTKLVSVGELEETPSGDNARVKQLSLAAQGQHGLPSLALIDMPLSKVLKKLNNAAMKRDQHQAAKIIHNDRYVIV